MPIRINLLEEEQKQKLAKQRDPFLLALRFSGLWVGLVGMFSLILYTQQRSLREQLTALNNEWSLREPKYLKTLQELDELRIESARSDLLKLRMKTRFLWAPQLELFKDVVPANIQITRFVGRREVSTPPPVVAGSKLSTPTPSEVVRVTLEGIAEGVRPELVVNDFLMELKENDKLAPYVEEVKLISLTKSVDSPGRSASPETVATDGAASARFVIEITYKSNPVKQSA